MDVIRGEEVYGFQYMITVAEFPGIEVSVLEGSSELLIDSVLKGQTNFFSGSAIARMSAWRRRSGDLL